MRRHKQPTNLEQRELESAGSEQYWEDDKENRAEEEEEEEEDEASSAAAADGAAHSSTLYSATPPADCAVPAECECRLIHHRFVNDFAYTFKGTIHTH